MIMTLSEFSDLIDLNRSHEAYQIWGRKALLGLRECFRPQDQFYIQIEGAIKSAMGVEDSNFYTRIKKIQEVV